MCTLSPQPSAPVAEQLFGHSCVRDTHSFDRYQAYHSALDNYRDTGRAPPGGRTKIVTLTVHSYHVDNGRPTIGAWWPFAGARSRGLCGLPPSYQTLLPASPIRCFALSRTFSNGLSHQLRKVSFSCLPPILSLPTHPLPIASATIGTRSPRATLDSGSLRAI